MPMQESSLSLQFAVALGTKDPVASVAVRIGRYGSGAVSFLGGLATMAGARGRGPVLADRCFIRKAAGL
jgi:hypothetical protein